MVVSSVSEVLQQRSDRDDHRVLDVITRNLFEAVREASDVADQVLETVESDNAEFYRYDGSISYSMALFDERIAVVVLADDEGIVRGHVESTDRAFRDGVTSTIEEHRLESELLSLDTLRA